MSVREAAQEAAFGGLMKISQYYDLVGKRYGKRGKIVFGVSFIALVSAAVSTAFSMIGTIVGWLVLPVVLGAAGFFAWKFGRTALKEYINE